MNYSLIFNAVGFNLAWFGLVYWGNAFIPISLLLLLAHFYFNSQVKGELLLMVIITFFGILVDSLLQQFTFFIFAEHSHLPFWLITLWACFSATICHSLHFLAGSKVLQLLVGGLFAPLSYIAGQKMAAVEFGQSLLLTYVTLSLLWGLLFVLFFMLKNRLVKV